MNEHLATYNNTYGVTATFATGTASSRDIDTVSTVLHSSPIQYMLVSAEIEQTNRRIYSRGNKEHVVNKLP
jgi:hypothetical protein